MSRFDLRAFTSPNASAAWTQYRRTHAAYYALALFNILIVVFSLYSTHTTTRSYARLLAANERWVERLRDYETLAELGAVIDAPANDVFESQDVVGERRRLQHAVEQFEAFAAKSMASAEADGATGSNAVMLERLDAVRSHARRTADFAEETFTLFDAGDHGGAAARMVLMDREYQQLARGLSELRQVVAGLQTRMLAEEQRTLALVQRYQDLLGAAIVVMVIAMVAYGRVLAVRTAEQREERQRVERAVAASEKWFRSIVETTADWIWAIDIRGIFTYSNDSVKAVLGFTPEELAGQSVMLFVDPRDQDMVRERLRRAVESGTGWAGITRWRHKDGGFRHLEGHAVAYDDTAGQLAGFRGVDRDVTVRQHSEQMKSDFVSFVSHQLRTPLAGINWMLELAAGDPGVPEDARGYIGDARESSARLSGLVNDLLDISRLESGRMVIERELVDVPALTKGILAELSPLIRERSLDVAFQNGHVPELLADGKLLRQALMNLVSNAIKYTPSNGTITLAIASGQGAVEWSIRDSGIGIPKTAQPRLFQKFFRAENAMSLETEGTGLGLYLVRLIVEQFDGTVTCESEMGQGSTFRVRLPLPAEGVSA